MSTTNITAATAFLPENRRRYLGGTDVSAIAGFNGYKSAFDVWLEKTGQLVKEDESDKDLFYWGHKLEPLIADRWLEKNPDWEILTANDFVVDPEFEFICANMDRIIRHKTTGELAVLECKTVASSAFRQWNLGVPYTYYTQGQHYLGVTGYDRVIFAIFVMDSRALETFEIIRDDAYIEELRDTCVKFWFDCVVGNVAPDKTAADWAKIKATTEYATATESDIMLYDKLKELKEREKELKALIEEAGDMIKERIGDAEGMKTAEGKVLFTWKGSDTDKVAIDDIRKKYPEVFKALAKTEYTRRFLTK